MNNVIKKFAFFAEFAVFILLALLLSVINTVNFAMASDDADFITQRIAEDKGMFGADRDRTPSDMQQFDQNKNFRPGGKKFGGLESMGPDSPEMSSSIRYFTYAFDNSGNAQKIVFKMSAVTENEAQEWAKGLLGKTVGWTNVNYRYRVYEIDGMTYVTVIDQGRELLPSYRILIISIAGGAAMLILSMIILLIAGKQIFKPIEEADRRQKKFISNVEHDFRLPLTVINANTELIEKRDGPSENTNIINRQVRKMTAIVKDMSSFSVLGEEKLSISRINISDIMMRAIDSRSAEFEENNIAISVDIEPEILIEGDGEAFKKAFEELAENTLKYSVSQAGFRLVRQKNRITLTLENDCELPSGQVDQVFDRFTTLKNSKGKNSIGLGLSYVKQIITAHNGRVSAKVVDGKFILNIYL